MRIDSITIVYNSEAVENSFNTDSIHWTANPESAHWSRTVKSPSTIQIAEWSLKRQKILNTSPEMGRFEVPNSDRIYI